MGKWMNEKINEWKIEWILISLTLWYGNFLKTDSDFIFSSLYPQFLIQPSILIDAW